MKKTAIGIAILVVALVAGIAFYSVIPTPEATTTVGSISAASALNTVMEGYERALVPRAFAFPADHAAHPAYKTEWWYFTGNLQTEQGRMFGFQLTFFRSALSPDSVRSSSAWASNQLYMAHFALADIADDQFYSFERFSRGGAELAGVVASPFRVWLYDWRVQGTGSALFPLQLQAKEGDVALSLVLDSLKPMVLQGERGLSKKGKGEGNASYYYSFPRITVRGNVAIAGATHEVRGTAWLDREWSSSALEKEQTGWDWFSLQLSDGRELMYFQLRDTAGRPDAFSAGTLISRDGSATQLHAGDVDLAVQKQWKSPHSGVVYPAEWRVRVPAEQIDVVVTPHINDQELQVSVRYWEGAVGVRGTASGQRIEGNGYVEMTGYDHENK